MLRYIVKIKKLRDKITHLRVKRTLDPNEPEEEYSINFIIRQLMKSEIKLKTALKKEDGDYSDGSYVEVMEHSRGHPILKTCPKKTPNDEVENLPQY